MSSGTLTFPISELLHLAQHASSAKEHSHGYDILFDPRHHVGGAIRYEHDEKGVPGSWPDAKNIDTSTVGPNLMLVKDRGVYLMSSGRPAIPASGEIANAVYAKESNPNDMEFDDWYEAGRLIMGDDDCVITLFDLPQQVVDAANQGHSELLIRVSETKIECISQVPSPKSRQRQTN